MKKIIITVEDNGEVKIQEEEFVGGKTRPSASCYARFFDEECAYWSNDPEGNMMFLRAQENYANEKLRNRGYLFLNDVYDMLGMPRTKSGQVIGWIYDEKNPNRNNYVSFGIFDENNRRFVNGYEKSVLLDFNVDGNILNMFSDEES